MTHKKIQTKPNKLRQIKKIKRKSTKTHAQILVPSIVCVKLKKPCNFNMHHAWLTDFRFQTMSSFYGHIIHVLGDSVQWQLRRLGLVVVMMLGAHCTFHSDRVTELIQDISVLRTSKQIATKNPRRCSICSEMGELCGHYCTLHSSQGKCKRN